VYVDHVQNTPIIRYTSQAHRLCSNEQSWIGKAQ
jgi:hypothetical protein